MPKVTSYTPPWLSRPSPASRAFMRAQDEHVAPAKRTSHSVSPTRDGQQKQYYGPHRLLARRGTEIFVVVENQIRWLDVQTVKNEWENEGNRQHEYESQMSAYRVLIAPIYHQIRQLIVSPSGHFLAVLTEHTVHIAILPDSSHLAVKDRPPLKIKTHQLGPTTHVLPQSPVVSVLWHPLACSTTALDCLVTITVEAAVRVWEIDRNNLWSFDRPSLAIDLQKLADGTSCHGDFEPSGFGKNKGFSVDSFEMEVSAACFGGRGREEENGWAPMTLFTAMRNGDVYALCPLLPKKWRPTSTLIPSLSTSVVSNMACVQDDSVDPDRKRAAQQQFEWFQEIDNEEPLPPHADADPLFNQEIRSLPLTPGAIPRLQGPFLFDVEENELDLDVSDIHVVPAKIDAEDLLSGEEEDYADLEGLIQDWLPITVICLATTTGKVHVCLNLDNISGQWLPQTKEDAFSVPVGEPRDLILVESSQLGESGVTSENRPLFSQDLFAPYDFYLSASHRIDHVSLSSWASRLESELLSRSPSDNGLEFRIKVLCSGKIVQTEEILDYTTDHSWKSSQHLSNAIVMHSQNIGSLLLSCSDNGAHAAKLDTPEDTPCAMILTRARTDSLSAVDPGAQLDLSPPSEQAITTAPRSNYEPPTVFYEPPAAPLTTFLSTSVPQRHRAALIQPISLSPSTLDIMAAAHRILSLQTSQLEQAASELFRRCERLREEMEDQVRQMVGLADRIQCTDPAEEGEVHDRNTRCEKRISKTKERQLNINDRYEALRRKVCRVTASGRELSNKEKTWIREIAETGKDFGLAAEMETDPPEVQPGRTVTDRYDSVKDLADSLLSEAEEIQASQTKESPPDPRRSLASSTASPLSRISTSGVPPKVQKAKIEEAMLMVERETAVIEAVMASLNRLGHMQIDH